MSPDLHIRDWKHRWLNTEDPWEALGIWMEARWDGLTAEEKKHFTLQVLGYPSEFEGMYGYPFRGEETGELDHDIMLAVFVYAEDPELPTHMQEPYVHIDPFWI